MKNHLICLLCMAFTIRIWAFETQNILTNINTKIFNDLESNMRIDDFQVRRSALKFTQSNYEISDDDLTSMIMLLANSLTNAEDIAVRSYTVSSLIYFGNTNAVDFLKDEVLSGRTVSAGVCGYAVISGFDNDFYSFIDAVSAKNSSVSHLVIPEILSLLDDLLSTGETYLGRPLAKFAKEHAVQCLKKILISDAGSCIYADDILARHVQGYDQSDSRIAAIRDIIGKHPENSSITRYFRSKLSVLTNSTASAAIISAPMPRKVDERHIEDNEAQTSSANETRTNVFSGSSIFYILSFCVVVIFIAALVFRRHKQKKAFNR